MNRLFHDLLSLKTTVKIKITTWDASQGGHYSYQKRDRKGLLY